MDVRVLEYGVLPLLDKPLLVRLLNRGVITTDFYVLRRLEVNIQDIHKLLNNLIAQLTNRVGYD